MNKETKVKIENALEIWEKEKDNPNFIQTARFGMWVLEVITILKAILEDKEL